MHRRHRPLSGCHSRKSLVIRRRRSYRQCPINHNRTAAFGRVRMWRGGLRFSLSVTAPFVWRCLRPAVPSLRFHILLIEPDMRITRTGLTRPSRLHPRLAAPKSGQADESEGPVEVREGIRPAPASPDLVLVAQPPAQPRSGVVVERHGRPGGSSLPESRSPSRAGRGSTAAPTPWSWRQFTHDQVAAPRTPRYPRTLVHPRPARPDWSGTGHRQREEYPRGRVVVQGIEAIAGLSLRFRKTCNALCSF